MNEYTETVVFNYTSRLHYMIYGADAMSIFENPARMIGENVYAGDIVGVVEITYRRYGHDGKYRKEINRKGIRYGRWEYNRFGAYWHSTHEG